MNKFAFMVDGDTVSLHNLMTGTTTILLGGSSAPEGAVAPAPATTPTVPAITSAIDEMFRLAKGEVIPPPTSGWWDHQQTGEREKRETIGLEDATNYTRDPGGIRTVYELARPDKVVGVAFHVPGTGGIMTIDLVGKNDGDVNGGAEFGVGAKDAGPDSLPMSGQLKGLRFRRVVPVGQFANLFFRFDSGDSVLLLAVNQNG